MKIKIILAFAIAITTLNLGAQVVSPVQPAKIKGHTYAEWSERWWQWVFSLPVSQNPLFDNGTDVSSGQHDDVWFLGGSFVSSGKIVRNVSIPHDKLLFFPILNAWEDDTDCNGSRRISFGEALADLRSDLEANIDTATNVSCSIDTTDVPGLSDAPNSDYRVKTPSPNGFSYDLPGMDNFLDYVLEPLGLTCWKNANRAPIHVDANIYHPVGDGIYIMLAPLAPGTHILHFHGEAVFFGSPFTLDVTYNITSM